MEEELVKVIPVLLGGVLAIAGGLGSQLVVHWLSDRRDRTKIRRDHLEALVKAVYAHGQWISDMQRMLVFRNEDHDVASPLDEARMIQTLYFPSLGNELIAVQEAAIPLMTFSGEQRLKHMKDTKTFLEEWDPKPFNEGYKKYLLAVSSLVSRARDLLNSE